MSIEYDCARVLVSDRSNAEDRAEIFECGEDLVIVVADGAGGLNGGGAASDALVAVVAEEVRRTRDSFDPRRWSQVIHETDMKLAAQMSGETTGVLIALSPRGLIGASAGDSEAWIVKESSIDDLTVHQREETRRGRLRRG